MGRLGRCCRRICRLRRALLNVNKGSSRYYESRLTSKLRDDSLPDWLCSACHHTDKSILHRHTVSEAVRTRPSYQ